MTVPLVFIPTVYARLTGTDIVLPGHWAAAAGVVMAAALGHLFLYGAGKEYRGIRNIVFPIGSRPDLRRALRMEFIYAVTHFGTIVATYRLVVASQLGPVDVSVLYPAVIAAVVWFTGVCAFTLLRYPESLGDSGWVEVRGVVHGLMLVVTLQGGMLMK